MASDETRLDVLFETVPAAVDVALRLSAEAILNTMGSAALELMESITNLGSGPQT